MGLRAIDPAMDASVVAEIDRRLDAIARDDAVALPLAIESGSRAWGFPSPDSDYDCRFIFTRPAATTFSIVARRDVIEREVTPVFDLGGWELRKALVLMLRGNAVVIEWLTSPVTYRGRADFRDEFLALAARVSQREQVMRHYARLAFAMRHRLLDAGRSGPDHAKAFPLKKLFYVLRPIAAWRWLADRPDAIVAPMHFPTLIAETDLPADLRATIDGMLAAKARTRELGLGPIPPAVERLVEDALEHMPHARLPREIAPERLALADGFHHRWVEELDETAKQQRRRA